MLATNIWWTIESLCRGRGQTVEKDSHIKYTHREL
jgi:hypothetical protein